MITPVIGHHPQTTQGDTSRGRLDNRRVQPVGSTSSSYGVSKMVLGILSLLFTRASAQFTGTYYPEAAVNLGAGSEPLLFAGGGVAQLLYGNGAGLNVGQLDQFGALEPSPKQIDNRAGLLHSKHVATYPDGSYALALEVPRDTVYDIEACLWNSAWQLTKCTPIYTWAPNDLVPYDVDIAGSPTSTLLTFHRRKISCCDYDAYYALLDAMFGVTISPTHVVMPDEGPERNPSVIWLEDKYKVGLEAWFDDDDLIVRAREYSEAGTSLGGFTSISGLITDISPLDGGPPDLRFSNLGTFGHVLSWESQSPSPNGHYVLFYATDDTILGTYNIDTSPNAHSGVFTGINSIQVAGAWARDDAGAYKVILEIFERSGNTVAAVIGSSITVFEDTTNPYTSVSALALPNERGLVVAAEKAGITWTRVIYFNPLTSAPTSTPTSAPTLAPTSTPTNQPTPGPTPLPTSSMTANPAVLFNETLSSSRDKTSLTSGDLFTMPTSSPPETVKSVPKTKTEESSLAWVSGIVVPLILSVVGTVFYMLRKRGNSHNTSMQKHRIGPVRKRTSTGSMNHSLSASRMHASSHPHPYTPPGNHSSSVTPALGDGAFSPKDHLSFSSPYDEAPQGGGNKASYPVPHNGKSIYDNIGAPPGIPTGRSYNIAYAGEGVYEDVRVRPNPYDEAPDGGQDGKPSLTTQNPRQNNYDSPQSLIRV